MRRTSQRSRDCATAPSSPCSSAAGACGVKPDGWQITILAKKRGGTERCALDRPEQGLFVGFGLTRTGRDGASGGQQLGRHLPPVPRPLEQRRTSGGKARNTAFPNAAMFSQTIIIAYGSVMPNWPRPPVQERSVGPSGDPTEAACLPGRVGRRIRHYVAQITRVASSAIARSCESEIPCLSSAGPPLLQRSASGRDAWPNRSIIVQ